MTNTSYLPRHTDSGTREGREHCGGGGTPHTREVIPPRCHICPGDLSLTAQRLLSNRSIWVNKFLPQAPRPLPTLETLGFPGAPSQAHFSGYTILLDDFIHPQGLPQSQDNLRMLLLRSEP